MERPPVVAAALLALGLLLAACGSDDDASIQGPDDMRTSDGGMMDDDMGDGMGGDGDDEHDESSDVAEDARRIEVTASSFEFDPDEIRVEAGEDLAIVLTSTDIIHDFTIDELDAHVSADGGETEEGGFTADEPGEYTFYCTVPGHRDAGMEGTLIVE